MRVIVASDVPFGSHRAHAINVIKTAGGFARLGHDVRLLLRAPGQGSAGAASDFDRLLGETYGEPRLSLECAPPLPAHLEQVHSESRQRLFAVWAAARAARFGAEAIYARHFETALACASAGMPTVVETHAYAGDQNPALLRTLDATRDASWRLPIVTIHPTLRADYIARGAHPSRVHIVPDGVDLEMFERPFQLPRCPFAAKSPMRAHAVYAGHLYEHKGIPTILSAAALLPDIGFHLVGGTPEDIERTQDAIASRGLSNVFLHGLRPYSEVPAWLWHADVLLLPPSNNEPSAGWTSPVKLGEYLASGGPIVASRIPGLATWVREPAVRWFTPDDAASLAAAIQLTLGERPMDQQRRQKFAAQYADEFSYRNRARKILRALATAQSGAIAGIRAS